jgi:transcriptional regulator of acetoin/glycerol metabolism
MDEREAFEDSGVTSAQSDAGLSESRRPPYEAGLGSLPKELEPGRLPIGKRPVVPLRESDAENVLNALFVFGNLMHATEALEIDRRTMYRKIALYGFEDWRERRTAFLKETKE